MGLSFDGDTILGTHAVTVGVWDYHRQENTIVGLAGATVLKGPRMTRMIFVESVLHDPLGVTITATQSTLEQYLNDIDARMGDVGNLVESGNLARTFEACEFMGFARRPDVEQLPPSGTIVSWFSVGRLIFKQLRPNA